MLLSLALLACRIANKAWYLCLLLQVACDRLLNFRVELKVAGKRIGDVLNKIHVAQVRGVGEQRTGKEKGRGRDVVMGFGQLL